MLVQVGTELSAVRLEPVSGDDRILWTARYAWSDSKYGRKISTFPVQLIYDLRTREELGPLGFEEVNVYDQPLGNVLVQPDADGSPLILMRQLGSVLAVELDTGDVRWRRLSVAPRDRLVPASMPGVCGLVGDRGTTLLSLADGSEQGWVEQTLDTLFDERVGRGDFVQATRDNATHLEPLDATQPPWSVPLREGEVAESSLEDVVLFDPASRTLRLIDASGTTWAEVPSKLQAGALWKEQQRLIIASVPDGALVGVGIKPPLEAIDADDQYRGEDVRPTLTGRLLFVRRDGTVAWNIAVENVAVPVLQPRDVPLVTLDYKIEKRHPLKMYTTATTDEPLLFEVFEDSTHAYFEIQVPRLGREILIKRVGEDLRLTYPAP